jgi:hypothetical protein
MLRELPDAGLVMAWVCRSSGGAMGTTETAGFMRAVADCAALGYSLYAFPTNHRAT